MWRAPSLACGGRNFTADHLMPPPTATSRLRAQEGRSSKWRGGSSTTRTSTFQQLFGLLRKSYETSILYNIALPRLLQLTSALMMGGGPGAKPEHMLVVVPFEEPTAIFDRIRKRHPHIKITYRNLSFNETPWKGTQEIPRGLPSPMKSPRSIGLL